MVIFRPVSLGRILKQVVKQFLPPTKEQIVLSYSSVVPYIVNGHYSEEQQMSWILVCFF